MRAPRRRIVLCALGAALGASVVAWAAPLTTSAAPLMARTVVGSVPITTCTLAPNADTYSDGVTAQGTATTLHVRTQLALNKRDLRAVRRGELLDPGRCTAEDQRLQPRDHDRAGSSRTYDVHRVTAASTEAGLTALAQPATAGTATASVVTGTTGGVTLAADVLADVSAYVTGTATNNGWRVKDRTEDGLSSVETRFGSRENATAAVRPALVVTYYP